MAFHLRVEDIFEIHEEILAIYTGRPGVRDPDAIDRALRRAQHEYSEDIVEQAALLLESLAANKPFVDCNKRVAFGAADVFLRLNGYRWQGDPEETATLLIDMFEKGQFRYAEIEPWFKRNVVPLEI